MKDMNMLKEYELIDKIEEKLPQLLNSNFNIGSFSRMTRINDSNFDIDLLATLEGPNHVAPIKMAIEVKNTSRTSSILEAAYQAKSYANHANAEPFVASKFLSERIREMLKDQGVNYFDLAGNFYMNLPHMYYEKVVDKNPFSNTLPLKNLFAPVSSRITRVLLAEPKKAWYLSDIAEAADVSAGQTHNVMKAMAGEKFAWKNDEGKWLLSNPGELLDAWKEYYPTYQTKKYSFYSFSTNNLADKVRRAADELGLEYTLGFFSAADLIAPYVRHQGKVQFYTTADQVKKWANALDLKEVNSNGNVEIYVPYDKGVFYGKQMVSTGFDEAPVVSNIQLYMDLINNPARGEEAATHLREERIGF